MDRLAAIRAWAAPGLRDSGRPAARAPSGRPNASSCSRRLGLHDNAALFHGTAHAISGPPCGLGRPTLLAQHGAAGRSQRGACVCARGRSPGRCLDSAARALLPLPFPECSGLSAGRPTHRCRSGLRSEGRDAPPWRLLRRVLSNGGGAASVDDPAHSRLAAPLLGSGRRLASVVRWSAACETSPGRAEWCSGHRTRAPSGGAFLRYAAHRALHGTG